MSPLSNPTILVMGAHGMLGHTVYTYFLNHYPTWGTVRHESTDSHKLTFDAFDDTSLELLLAKIKNVDYIINCIGILPGNNPEEMQYGNATFPHKLAQFSEKHKIKVIHVSTDAVFPRLAGHVTEDTPPSPEDAYGISKLRGEPNSPYVLSIRTSLLGLDPYKQKGLLEWILAEKQVSGYTNQFWAGCTSLQFAKLCGDIIQHNNFKKMRKKSKIFHFSPLSNITKHAIIKTFLSLVKSKKRITSSEGQPLFRLLDTKYPELLFLDKQKRQLDEALQELITFEKSQKNEEKETGIYTGNKS